MDFLALAPVGDQAGHAHDGQVPADGGLGKLESLAQAGDVRLAFLKDLKDPQPCFVAKDVTQFR
jgi:hypothetical protein